MCIITNLNLNNQSSESTLKEMKSYLPSHKLELAFGDTLKSKINL